MIQQFATAFRGLAPFLRLNLAGGDLRPIAQALLVQANDEQDNAPLWMNLATVFFAIGQRETGLAIQAQALLMRQTYLLPAVRQPARLRLLLLMVAGDIAANTPLDCLLEDCDIDLICHYATPEQPLPAELPAHDAVLVAIGEGVENLAVLKLLAARLRNWFRPVINAPEHIPNTERRTASDLLQGVPGLLMPPTREVSRDFLLGLRDGAASLAEVFADCRLPIILRPVGSHAGRDLARIDDLAGLRRYLADVPDAGFYLSPFIDYSDANGVFRKFRIALIDGQPFACHMGISTNWMIHYLNAGMYEDAAKRAEEEVFMSAFAAFAERHGEALKAIWQRSQLDYLCIDCAETADGALLVFEIGHAMVVHAMDPVDLFPYKQEHMGKVKRAFENYLYGLYRARPAHVA